MSRLSDAQERCLRYLWDNRDKRGGVHVGRYDRARYGLRMTRQTGRSLVSRGLAVHNPRKTLGESGIWTFRITAAGRNWVREHRPGWYY